MFAALRVLTGLVLLSSGIEKTISPYQNFLYAIQAYQLLPSGLETAVALILPWIELAAGLFLTVGLWVPWSLRAALVFFAVFITVVGQALWRGLPIDQCGCFGEGIHIAPKVIILFDSGALLVTYLLLRNIPKTSRFSLDEYFSGKGR